MRRFLIKIEHMGGLLTVMLALCFILNRFLIKSDPFIVDPDVVTLIMGDSHGNYSFDTTYIRNSLNASQEGESMLVTYHKLKAILSDNPQIHNVLISFSPHNLSAFNDNKFRESLWANYMFDRYYPIISLFDLKELNIDRRRFWKSFVQNEVLLNGNYLLNRIKRTLGKGKLLYPYITPSSLLHGTYLHEERLTSAIERHYYYEGELLGISTIERSYLNAIVEFTESRQIQLYLVDTPLHSEYLLRIPGVFKEAYERAKRELAAEPYVHICDFERMHLSDTLFYDFDHVNAVGARVISQKLDRNIYGSE